MYSTSCDCYQTSSGWRYFSLLEKQFLDFMAAVLESYSSLQTHTEDTRSDGKHNMHSITTGNLQLRVILSNY